VPLLTSKPALLHPAAASAGSSSRSSQACEQLLPAAKLAVTARQLGWQMQCSSTLLPWDGLRHQLHRLPCSTLQLAS